MKRLQSFIVVVIAFVLLVSLAGCGSKQSVVLSTNPANTGGFQQETKNVFASQSECQSAEAECVKEIKANKITGNYLRVGEVAEGQKFELGANDEIMADSVCKTSLSPAVDAKEDGDACLYSKDAYVCTTCPDGSCQSAENKCNCPQDCK